MIDTKNKGQLGVVVVAAGRSSRFEGVDKQIAMLGGEAVIAHSLRVFDSFDEVGAIVLVMSPDNHEAGNAAVDLGGFSKVIGVVTGGKRRQDSVRIGLDMLAGQDGGAPEYVAVHDGARPFIDSEMVERGLATAQNQALATFEARGPLSPCTTSKLTLSPSERDLNPSV